MVPFFGKEQKLNSVLIESNYQLSDSSDAEDQNFGKRRGRSVVFFCVLYSMCCEMPALWL